MDQFLEKLKKAKSIVGFDRKEEMRADLMRYAGAHEHVTFRNEPRHTLQRSIKNIFSNMTAIAGIVIAALLTVGGGVSFAAQNALPGDILYPVKVGVNEQVETALAFSPEAKAQVESQLASARVDEAATLAAEGKLNAQTQGNLDQGFESHARNAESNILKLKSAGNLSAAAGAASDLEAGLGVQAQVLAGLGGKSSTTERAVSSLAVHVNKVLGEVKGDRADIESEIASNNASGTQVAAQGKIGAAANVIAEADSFVSAKTAQFGASSTVSAEVQLAAASTTLAQARAQLSAGAYGEAFKLASTALRTAQEAKALVQANAKFNLHIGGGHDEARNQPEASSSGDGGTAIHASGTVQGENENETEASSSGEYSGKGSSSIEINGGIHLNLGE